MDAIKTNLSLDDLRAQIKERHDIQFLEELLALPDAKVLLFGGVVRDTILGKPWKDLDVRVIYPVNKAGDVKNIITKHGAIVQEVPFPTFVVYMANMPGPHPLVIDVSVADTLENPPCDFKACALFIDLRTGEILEQVPSALKDLQDRLIRPVGEIGPSLKNEPHLVLRALKLMCQADFILHPDFEAAVRADMSLMGKAIVEMLDYIHTHGKDAWTDHLLGNFFNGLKANPTKYLALLKQYNLLDPLLRALIPYVRSPLKDIRNEPLPIFPQEISSEEAISIFLSYLVRGISDNPGADFDELKHAFALDVDTSPGNEFVVASARIKYRP